LRIGRPPGVPDGEGPWVAPGATWSAGGGVLWRGLRRLRPGGCGKNRRGEQCYRSSRRKKGSDFHVQGILSRSLSRLGEMVWVQFSVGIGMRKDACAAHRLRPGNAAIPGKDKTQGQFHGVTDADASRDEHAPGAYPIIAQLQW
jgi:hypothetical protein